MNEKQREKWYQKIFLKNLSVHLMTWPGYFYFFFSVRMKNNLNRENNISFFFSFLISGVEMPEK